MRLILIALLACSASAYAATALVVDAHFAYRITGDRIAAPVQVFDNKGKTYLQLRNMNTPPAVFGEDGQPLTYLIQSPYLILDGVYPGLLLRYGRDNAAKIKNADYVAKAPLALVPVETKVGAGADGHKNNLWFGGAEAEAKTGGAKTPEPDKTPEQKTIESKNAPPAPVVSVIKQPEKKVESIKPVAESIKPVMTGKFLVGDNIEKEKEKEKERAAATGKFEKKIESESDSVEFTVQGGKLYPVQTVRLSTLVKKIGKSGVYVISNGKSRVGEANGVCIKDRLIALGVPATNVKIESKQPVDNDYVVIITGEKK